MFHLRNCDPQDNPQSFLCAASFFFLCRCTGGDTHLLVDERLLLVSRRDVNIGVVLLSSAVMCSRFLLRTDTERKSFSMWNCSQYGVGILPWVSWLWVMEKKTWVFSGCVVLSSCVAKATSVAPVSIVYLSVYTGTCRQTIPCAVSYHCQHCVAGGQACGFMATGSRCSNTRLRAERPWWWWVKTKARGAEDEGELTLNHVVSCPWTIYFYVSVKWWKVCWCAKLINIHFKHYHSPTGEKKQTLQVSSQRYQSVAVTFGWRYLAFSHILGCYQV